MIRSVPRYIVNRNILYKAAPEIQPLGGIRGRLYSVVDIAPKKEQPGLLELTVKSLDRPGATLHVSLKTRVDEPITRGTIIELSNNPGTPPSLSHHDSINSAPGYLNLQLQGVKGFLAELSLQNNPHGLFLVYSLMARNLKISGGTVKRWSAFLEKHSPVFSTKSAIPAGICVHLHSLGLDPKEHITQRVFKHLSHQPPGDVASEDHDFQILNLLTLRENQTGWYFYTLEDTKIGNLLFWQNYSSGQLVVSLSTTSNEIVFFTWVEPERKILRWYHTGYSPSTSPDGEEEQRLLKFVEAHRFKEVQYINDDQVFDGFSIYNPSTILKSVDIKG
ncbi:hypothetical protein [Spirochaeta lutea]|uniref:Uncharacterized protein n=1 Tax=Spirochaeta lutea TaxID=1480694 RepID=A0A098R1U1_9SPIO|nr:hypothetical protein [Spirochaeta lutea]KGE73944.1 hypothetical protein DC28_01845 [Spirochaeta lutea]